jgi:membrane associated rhomboid family serine protease
VIPIGDEPNEGGTPFVTYALIAANVLAFVVLQGMGAGAAYDASMRRYTYVPADPSLFTAFTSMFMHADWMHLLGNMLFLWIFGDNVEARLGRVGFLAAYLATGLLAGVAHGLSDASSAIPSLGASGAISGVQGLYLVAFPRNRVKLLFIYYIVRVIRVPAIGIMLFWFVMNDLLPTFASIGRTTGGGVAHMAHIGGFVSGILICFSMRSSVKALERGGGGGGPYERRGGPVGPGNPWGDSRGPQRWDGGRGVGGWVGGGRGRTTLLDAEPSLEGLDPSARILALWRAGRFSEAAAALAASLKGGARLVLPDSEFVRLCGRLYDEGRYEDAKVAFEAYLRTNPKDAGTAVASFALGMIASRRDGDLETARRRLLVATRFHPDPASRELAMREIERIR